VINADKADQLFMEINELLGKASMKIFELTNGKDEENERVPTRILTVGSEAQKKIMETTHWLGDLLYHIKTEISDEPNNSAFDAAINNNPLTETGKTINMDGKEVV